MTRTNPVRTPFGFDSTAEEVIAGIDLSGTRAIVTGGSSGIGIETARALAGAGADVTLAVRDTEAGARTAVAITALTGNDAVRVGRLDLADQASVAAFVADWRRPLHVLVNNAAVMGVPERRLTPEGWELQLATNHVGHVALALGLHDALAAADDARIVSVSSEAHLRSPLVFDDLHFASRPYDPWRAYGQSKTANVLFAVAAARRWHGDDITVSAVHPGAVPATGLARHVDPGVLADLVASSTFEYKTLAQGAATSVLVPTSPQLAGISGRYFADCNEAPVIDPKDEDSRGFGVAAHALDSANAERLWNLSLAALGRAGDITAAEPVACRPRANAHA
jgi:NAD(P)-dependent dehydrogenase (short-subunit alcohol dehydrogenase family)